MTRPPSRTVVLSPDVTFGQVHDAFVAAGWEGGPITLGEPMVAAEPELARYRNGQSTATYTADPVTWLRLVTTVDPLPLPDLPQLRPATVLAWLAETDPDDEQTRQRRLLAVVAAAELGLTRALPRLRRLAASADVLVADAARRAAATLRPR